MPDATNVETGREGAAPASCPECKRVLLILFTCSAGIIEHARVGCLCRSVVVLPDAKRSGPRVVVWISSSNSSAGVPSTVTIVQQN